MEDWDQEGVVEGSKVNCRCLPSCHEANPIIRRLGFAPFALSLAILVHLKRRKLAPMQGWVGKGVTWLDADWERAQEAKSECERD